MKKLSVILLLLLSIVFASFSLVACDNGGDPPPSEDPTPDVPSPDDPSPDEPTYEPMTFDASSVSYSLNTKHIMQKLQMHTPISTAASKQPTELICQKKQTQANQSKNLKS